MTEVARLLVQMIVVSHRFDNELMNGKGVGNIFDKVCLSLDEKRQSEFLKATLESFAVECDHHNNYVDLGAMEEIFDVLRNFGAYITKKALYESFKPKIEGEAMELEE